MEYPGRTKILFNKFFLDKRDGHKHGNGGSQELWGFPEQLQCGCGVNQVAVDLIMEEGY